MVLSLADLRELELADRARLRGMANMSTSCANPILLGFVAEWLETARMRSSKGVTTYKKAYDSLKACPLTFTHPSEAKQLTGFGDKLCSRLTEKLKEYCDEIGEPMPELPHKRKRKSNAAVVDDGDEDNQDEPAKKARKKKPKTYMPAYNSGPYGIIIALSTLDEGSHVGLTKQEVIDLAQPHCKTSYTIPADTSKFYTAWASMKTLGKNDLVVIKSNRPQRYFLTDDGWELAKSFKKAHNPSEGGPDNFNINNGEEAGVDDDMASLFGEENGGDDAANANKVADSIPLGEHITSSSALPKVDPIVLPPGSFTVRLLLDNREVRAKTDRNYIGDELRKKGVDLTVKPLALGDIFWVAKMRDPKYLSRYSLAGDEVTLDYIVERKRLDDLIGSIKDGRFHEQKFRLRRSGIKNVIYIIEEFSLDSNHFEKYEESVQSAITSMQVVNGFFVKKTQKIDDTIHYLTSLTKMFQAKYEKEPLRLIPTKILTSQNFLPLLKHLKEKHPSESFHITYEALAGISSKSGSDTLRDTYLKMLMCTRGITGEKALEIQKRWKTPSHLAEAYRNCGDDDLGRNKKFELVSNEMGHLVGRKKIAKATSTNIAKVWGCEGVS
ncbi:Restriction endonuclease-like protein [Glarea lozoyensis ATCC 20868]|uniref:Crossover junction endonuclease MUS81 n=1 Tax=Glarea lozoyensis (strain ATCC 20868 / MF5171) TaxID=1116229 RepID=S3EE15_GLAL2|nr:Restriction endonuclease-like protein [Glarea lozoyensis ATCC 20868]EPE36518.1 Restriction endonuclease-like protein [Glarea lozoyensis ATCC 20868]